MGDPLEVVSSEANFAQKSKQPLRLYFESLFFFFFFEKSLLRTTPGSENGKNTRRGMSILKCSYVIKYGKSQVVPRGYDGACITVLFVASAHRVVCVSVRAATGIV